MKSFFFLIFFAFSISIVNAQWNNEGPNSGLPNYKLLNCDSFLITASNFGIFKSYDNGINWNLLPNISCENYSDLIIIGNRLITNSSGGISISDDYGSNWYFSNNGINTSGAATYKNSLEKLPNGQLFVCLYGPGIYSSLDSGATWVSVSTPFSEPKFIVYDTQTEVLVVGSTSGIYVSHDFGQNWLQKNSGLSSTNITSLGFVQNVWFCSINSSNEIYFSQDTTFQWSIPLGITNTYLTPILVFSENRVLANRRNGVLEFNFALNQFEFSTLNNPIPINVRAAFDTMAFVYPVQNNLSLQIKPLVKSNGSSILQEVNFRTSVISKYNLSQNTLFTGNWGFSNTIGLGNSSTFIDNTNEFGTTDAYLPNCIAKRGVTFYAGSNSGVWISTDSAQTFTLYSTGLPLSQPGNKKYVYDLEVFGDTIIVSTDYGPYISTNAGNSFAIANFPNSTSSKDLLFHNGKIYSGGSPYLLVSDDLGANWTQFGNITAGFLQLAAAGPYIYAASEQEIYLTIDSLGITSNITGNLGQYLGPGNNPGIAAYDSLLFVSALFRVGVHKMNINQPGVYNDVSDNLPFYEAIPGINRYPYLTASYMTIFDNKLWLGTAGLSCFTRPLSDFGYPPVVTDKKVEVEVKKEEGLRVYPNPANSQLNVVVNCKGKTPLQIQITDVSGALVYRESTMTASGILQISTHQFAPGFYLLKLSDAEGKFDAVKFVKQ